jgi:hypothetical protein
MRRRWSTQLQKLHFNNLTMHIHKMYLCLSTTRR